MESRVIQCRKTKRSEAYTMKDLTRIVREIREAAQDARDVSGVVMAYDLLEWANEIEEEVLRLQHNKTLCTRPPAGWYCGSQYGHSGPCPAWPVSHTTAIHFVEDVEAITLLKKAYDGESICDVFRDVSEAFDADFTPEAKQIPSDEYGFALGKYVVEIRWSQTL
jgi:hypothetical protein